jgi:branched-chain amino acid transport system permease protein
VFVLSAGICGLAGALRALHLSVVPIDSLHYLQSGQAVMMCLLGGMGTFFGPSSAPRCSSTWRTW